MRLLYEQDIEGGIKVRYRFPRAKEWATGIQLVRELQEFSQSDQVGDVGCLERATEWCLAHVAEIVLPDGRTMQGEEAQEWAREQALIDGGQQVAALPALCFREFSGTRPAKPGTEGNGQAPAGDREREPGQQPIPDQVQDAESVQV